jgi:molecular chaperone GrpE
MTEDEENSDLPEAEPEPAPQGSGVTAIDAFRARAEAAEAKLHDYIGAFRQSQADAEAFRERVTRDMERKVELKFAALVRELLGSVDDLELALAHVTRTPEAEPLARGVSLALQGFLQTLERHGVIRITPDGEPFDPAVAEAVRVDPVDDPELDGVVTQTMRPGYRLGEQLVRPAAVAVGRRTPS